MKKILKKDHIWLGIVLGILMPIFLYGIIYGINELICYFFHLYVLLVPSTMYLIAIVSNIFVFRYYMVKIKYDRTGRGILLVTFIYILIYFAHEYLIK